MKRLSLALIGLIGTFLLTLPALAQNLTVYSAGSVAIGTTRQLTAYVPLVDPRITWTVNGIAGGNAVLGTVSANGLYSAPADIPTQNIVSVGVVSIADPTKTAQVAITITQPPVQVWSSNPSQIPSGAFTLSLNGVNFTSATIARLGDSPLTTKFISPTAIKVSGVATDAMLGKKMLVSVSNPGLGGTSATPLSITISATAPPATGDGTASSPTTPTTTPTTAPPVSTGPIGPGKGTPNLAAGRLLDQAAFGPTTGDLARVNQLGVDGWLVEQFNLPETPVLIPGGGTGMVQSQYVARLSSAPDQLRQRVIDALSRIIVISANKNIYADELAPYVQILSRNAFGNYRTLLGEISVSPQMGKYLDLANSNKPGSNTAPNENYARELMQLFTIGLNKLNPDGSLQLDNAGNPIPTYDQTTIGQVALALTGWTYQGPNNNNWENFTGPLVPRDANHDMRAKSFLGCNLPAKQSTQADMNATLDCIYAHPNVPPFIAIRLIRALVTSNPTPAYIQRVANVFADNGQGVRGDLKAVITAILKDPEARNDSAVPNGGRLKDPIYHVIGFVRTLGGTFSPTNGLNWQFGQLAETPLAPASVFSFYSPLYHVPKSTLTGPEFQIYTPTESVLRGNMFWALITNPGTDASPTMAPFLAVANDTTKLVDLADQTLLYGRMPQAMRQALADAINAQGDATSRARTAVYLTAISGLYAVQY